jgi:hypothetical protein
MVGIKELHLKLGIFIIYLILSFLKQTCATSYGAPLSACKTMFPQHGAEPMKGKSPYKIIAVTNSETDSRTVSGKELWRKLVIIP